MEITSNIKNKIEEIYKDSNYNVRTVSLGRKKVGDEKTDEIAIVIRVEKKKPLSELSADEIVPKTITIDGQDFKTDVIEDPSEITAIACFTSTDPDVLKLQGDPALLTPLKGGQELTQFPTGWTDFGGGSYGFTVGTLGFIGVDDIDGKIVGVTNNHVVIGNGDINGDRDIPTEVASPYNIIEPIEWVVDSSSYAPGALLRDESAPGTFVDGAPNIKRYIPFDVDGTNYVDVALLIMDPTKVDNTSYQIHQPTGETAYTDYLPFASTAEIDSLLATPRTIYSTGRTTGPKGWGVSASCTLEITALAETISVSGLSDTNLTFSDVVRFEFTDGSNYPIDSGDSGSAVVADFDGTRKIVGLAFAGSLTAGFFCRIDRIADAIKIRQWDEHYVYDDTVPAGATLKAAPIEDSSADSVTVTPECKYLFQAGTSMTDTYDDLLAITPLACSVTPTVTPEVTPTPSG
jgi:hypothetical protein